MHWHIWGNKFWRRITETIRLRDIFAILIGACVGSFGTQVFIVQGGLLGGGVTGIAILVTYLHDRFSLATLYFVFNIPILIAGYWFVSKRFIFYSLIGMVSSTFFIAQFARLGISIVDKPDIIINSVLGGLLTGLGSGIVMRAKGSCGGMDIVSIIVKRFWGYNVGQTMLTVNIVIITVFAFISGIEASFYTGISMFISAALLDKVVSGIAGKTAMIISDNPGLISQAIITELHRGCTYLSGYGAYTSETRQIILVTMGKTQLPRLREIVGTLDPQAFIIVNDSIEVVGQGFSSSKPDL
jgi:uncharacterized membrane-anchored protein YitT (DUF2179 family)